MLRAERPQTRIVVPNKYCLESLVNAISINSLYKYGKKEVKCFADNITSYFYHQETLTKKQVEVIKNSINWVDTR